MFSFQQPSKERTTTGRLGDWERETPSFVSAIAVEKESPPPWSQDGQVAGLFFFINTTRAKPKKNEKIPGGAPTGASIPSRLNT